MALATLCFAALDRHAKYLIVAERVPVAQVTWLRFVGHVVFSAVVLWPFALQAFAALGQAVAADLPFRC